MDCSSFPVNHASVSFPLSKLSAAPELVHSPVFQAPPAKQDADRVLPDQPPHGAAAAAALPAPAGAHPQLAAARGQPVCLRAQRALLLLAPLHRPGQGGAAAAGARQEGGQAGRRSRSVEPRHV